MFAKQPRQTTGKEVYHQLGAKHLSVCRYFLTFNGRTKPETGERGDIFDE